MKITAVKTVTTLNELFMTRNHLKDSQCEHEEITIKDDVVFVVRDEEKKVLNQVKFNGFKQENVS